MNPRIISLFDLVIRIHFSVENEFGSSAGDEFYTRALMLYNLAYTIANIAP
jgi:hypothetical protein